MNRWFNFQHQVIALVFASFFIGNCKSSNRSPSANTDSELSSGSDDCSAKLYIVEQLPVIDPRDLKPPKIRVDAVPIVKAGGVHSGNTQVKISVSFEESDPNGFDKPDV
ncbi:MAG: hypothetical protein HRU09_09560 [Oligoflexales bacterium]|nr:hypothetical protein [Oligoflexales bacterium]